MYTIRESTIFEQVISKSRFICYLFPITSAMEAETKLKEIRKKHYDATHNCFSYILGDHATNARHSDDGEPSQTAGLPIFETLRKRELTNVLAIVTRYFGGIKLGAGGLVRAYTSTTARAIEMADIVKIEKFIIMKISLTYPDLASIEKIIGGYQEQSRSFSETVEIRLMVPAEEAETFIAKLKEITKGAAQIITESE